MAEDLMTKTQLPHDRDPSTEGGPKGAVAVTIIGGVVLLMLAASAVAALLIL